MKVRTSAATQTCRLGVFCSTILVGLTLAAKPSWSDTATGIRLFQQGDYSYAFKELEGPASLGDADAHYYLGILYSNGQGVPEDDLYGVAWFQAAAEQGHVESQFELGVVYREGKVLPRDYAEALTWFRHAAEKGHAVAQVNLGELHETGLGTRRDLVEAGKWFSLAAAQGDQIGRAALDRLFARMTPAQVNRAQDLARAWRATSR